ncbi:WD40-repeat-containing domain protein [Boletus edulis BED1]|uniref:WD40-repeat-containing domain protein n=1 Tax=Boletus edulis BED1 TaxID=1328754 RepID=A0AAD4BLV4_BOLED|nr:WD40-repeat-containing domain protein [Boletus edulis BED1]
MIGPLKGHKDSVWCLLWSHDGRRLISGSDDATIRCWNADTGELIGQPWTGHTGGVYSITLSPDRSILASASLDHTVRFWDTTSGRPIGQQLEHVDAVTSVCFSPSGESVASAGWDGKMYLWRVRVLGLNSIAYKVFAFFRRFLVPVLIILRCRRVNMYGTLSPCWWQNHNLKCPAGMSFHYNVVVWSSDIIAPLRSTSLSVQFPPPPDLTPHIIRIQNQYSAGGSFGDVYKCRYHGSPVPMEVWPRFCVSRYFPFITSSGCSKVLPVQLHNRGRYGQ